MVSRSGYRLLGLVTGTLVLGFTTSAEAAHTYTVSGSADSASGSCSPSFVCTDLRAAVAAANSEPGSTIDLGAASYQLGGGHGVVVGTGELRISNEVTIQGLGPSSTRIDQTDGLNRVIEVAASAGAVVISGVEITGGNLVGATGGSPGAEGALVEGGGIANEAALTLSNDVIVGNSVTGGAGAGNSATGAGGPGGFALGGGIFSRGALTLTDSTVSGNAATSGAGGNTTGTGAGGASHNSDGGGIFENGKLVISSSTIAANTAAAGTPGTSSGGGAAGAAGNANGGAIITQAQPASIVNSTIAGNNATTPGGAFAVGAFLTASTLTSVTLASDTFAANRASGATTLISNLSLESNTLTTADTLFVAGAGAGVNCNLTGTTVNDDGHNLEEDIGASCGLSAARSDLVGVNPLLMPLASNGGPTQTMALGQGSPAIDTGGQCLDITQAGPPPLTSDQRGEPRANPCDIGAFESQPPSAASAPAIVGSPIQGQSLSCANGSWLGDLPLTFSTQWLRNGAAIAGATGSAYLVSAADVNQGLSCEVTAANIYGQQTAQSSPVLANAAPAAPASPAAPRITDASETNKTWREGSKLAKISKRRKPPVGTTFSFILNEQAAVTFTFTQRVSGRKVKGRCVAQTKRNRRKRACKRTVTRGTLSFTGHSGANKVLFQGPISRSKKLRPGRYTLVITATNAVGARSAPKPLSFTIVK